MSDARQIIGEERRAQLISGYEEEREEPDPGYIWILARRDNDGPPPFHYLPLVGEHYRSVNIHKPELAPSYTCGLDVPAYLRAHLADYRAGWPDFLAMWNRKTAPDYFNVLDGGCESCPVEAAAYLGYWLFQRVRSDVVTEHGGTVAGYSVTFDWGPSDADRVIAAAPYADPDWEVPADHPIAQCDGQTLLGGDW